MSLQKQWITPEAIIAKKQKYLMPCLYHFYKEPPQMVKGEGMYLYDHRGRSFLDFYSGVSVHALGHCHPELIDTIQEQVATLQHTTTIYLNESIVLLAEALAGLLPGDLCRSFFCASGSEAVEGACLLATLHNGSAEFIALQNGLHGRTKLGMSLTGMSFWRTDPNPVSGINHIPNCLQFSQGCTQKTVEYLENTIATTTSGKIAAFIAEPIQGNGGIATPPQDYFAAIYKVVKKAGGLFIVDETQTAFGRTGHNFGIDYYGVVPDIVCGGKALGGGTPCGFFATNDKIAQSYTRPGASTFGGNPITAEAGRKFLEILVRDQLVEKSRQKGLYTAQLLQNVHKEFPDQINDVRGRGLMWGVEMNEDFPIDNMLEKCKDEGLLLGKTGAKRNVLTIMPPLIVSNAQLKEGIDILKKALRTCIAYC